MPVTSAIENENETYGQERSSFPAVICRAGRTGSGKGKESDPADASANASANALANASGNQSGNASANTSADSWPTVDRLLTERRPILSRRVVRVGFYLYRER